MWAYAIALSRSFSDEYIPFLDFFRGSSKMKGVTSFVTKDGESCVVANKKYVEGEEVFLPLFEEKENENLWVKRGYFIEDNPKTGFSLQISNKIDKTKEKMLEKIYPIKKPFFLSKNFKDIPINLWKIFRVHYLEENDLKDNQILSRIFDCNDLFLESGFPDFESCGVSLQHEITTVAGLRDYFNSRFQVISGFDLKDEDFSHLPLQERSALKLGREEMNVFKHFYLKFLSYYLRLQDKFQK